MTTQYLRRVSLTVEGAGKTIGFDGEGGDDLTQLRIRFNIQQQDTSTPNVADIYVTNLSDDTANRVRQEFKSVTLAAGYRDNAAILFKGEIIQVRIGRENVTDKYLHIRATSGERARNDAVVSKTLAPGHTYRDRLNVYLAEMQRYGVTVGHISDLGSRKFPKAFAAWGNVKDGMRELCFATGTSWSIQNGKVQVLKNDEALPGGAIVLNSHTGLVGLPTQTIQGIEGRCLLNPRIVPGCLVKIDQRSIQQATLSASYASADYNAKIPGIAADGLYKIWVANYVGDTRGLEFYTEFIGVRNGDPISVALASRGIGVEQVQGSGGSANGNDAPATASPNAFTDQHTKAGPR